jgi:hypothetical protein
MSKLLQLLSSLLMLGLTASAVPARGEPGLFEVASGTYRAVTPTGWDGRRKLPLVLYTSTAMAKAAPTSPTTRRWSKR